MPTNLNGYLEPPTGEAIGIERHILKRTQGKLPILEPVGELGSDYSLVDYNRAGIPLIEIVSEPEIRTIEQAKAYVSELRNIILALGISDAKMEEGSIRVDANVSVRENGEDNLRTRANKNVNSLKSLAEQLNMKRIVTSAFMRMVNPQNRKPVIGMKMQEELVPADQRKMLKITVISLNRT